MIPTECCTRRFELISREQNGSEIDHTYTNALAICPFIHVSTLPLASIQYGCFIGMVNDSRLLTGESGES